MVEREVRKHDWEKAIRQIDATVDYYEGLHPRQPGDDRACIDEIRKVLRRAL